MSKYALLFFTVLLLGCQGWIAAKNMATNIVTAPISWMKSGYNLITGNTYDSYVEKTDEAKPSSIALASGGSPCLYAIDGKVIDQETFDALSDDMKKIAQTTCSCRPWGDCEPGEFCGCEKLCPDDMTIFDHPDNKSNDTENPDNCLAFRNNPWEFAYSEEPMSNGYCWGHASMTAKFNRIGFFRPEKKVPCLEVEDLSKRCEEGDEEWLEYYEKIIYDIKNNIPREIPGFPHLNAFSGSNDSLKIALGNTVANEWGQKAMTRQGVDQVLTGGQEMSKRGAEKLFERVSTNTRFKLNTQLLFSPKDHGMSAHVVLATKAYEENGIKIICIRDNNVSEYQTLDMPDGKCAPDNQMKIHPDNKITYPRAVNMTREYEEVDKEEYEKKIAEGVKGYESAGKFNILSDPGSDLIGTVKIAHNDGNDTVKQLHTLGHYCREERSCK